MIDSDVVKNEYVGDGTTREWSFTFECMDVGQIKAKLNGSEITENYSINFVNRKFVYPTIESGLVAIKPTDIITIYRNTEKTQEIDFENGGLLNARMIEDGLDKLTMITQELDKTKTAQDITVNDFKDGVIQTQVRSSPTHSSLPTEKAVRDLVDSHTQRQDNPHNVTKAQVGLGNADNTSDETKNLAIAILDNKTIDGGTF